MKPNKCYVVQAVHTKHEVEVGQPGKTNLDLVWADGMIGVLPVFNNKAKAKKYAGKGQNLLVFTAQRVQS